VSRVRAADGPAGRRRPSLQELVATALALQLLGAAGALAGPWAVTPERPAPAVVPATAATTTLTAEAAQGPAASPAGPVLLAAPDLWEGRIRLAPLGTAADGSLQVPATAAGLGWWRDGPRPGRPGAAVVVGHVDLDGRPGVFRRLARASAGDEVQVVADGSTRTYRVTRVDRYAKTQFPSDVVYQPVTGRELRLITCGGRFDRRTGHYEDNVVVTAVEVR
jgi:LPXTG-site transpeptidase (sortase) family protein